MAGVTTNTVRDLCNGKRWPWTSKRAAIELALGWETGRIAALATGEAVPSDTHRPRRCPDPTHGLDVREALTNLLEHSDLTPARRVKVLGYFLEQQEEQDRQQRRDAAWGGDDNSATT